MARPGAAPLVVRLFFFSIASTSLTTLSGSFAFCCRPRPGSSSAPSSPSAIWRRGSRPASRDGPVSIALLLLVLFAEGRAVQRVGSWGRRSESIYPRICAWAARTLPADARSSCRWPRAAPWSTTRACPMRATTGSSRRSSRSLRARHRAARRPPLRLALSFRSGGVREAAAWPLEEARSLTRRRPLGAGRLTTSPRAGTRVHLTTIGSMFRQVGLAAVPRDDGHGQRVGAGRQAPGTRSRSPACAAPGKPG